MGITHKSAKILKKFDLLTCSRERNRYLTLNIQKVKH